MVTEFTKIAAFYNKNIIRTQEIYKFMRIEQVLLDDLNYASCTGFAWIWLTVVHKPDQKPKLLIALKVMRC